MEFNDGDVLGMTAAIVASAVSGAQPDPEYVADLIAKVYDALDSAAAETRTGTASSRLSPPRPGGPSSRLTTSVGRWPGFPP